MTAVHNFSICAICKMCCAILKSHTCSRHITDLNPQPKPNHNRERNLNLTPNPNTNCGQIAQHILQIVQTEKLHAPSPPAPPPRLHVLLLHCVSKNDTNVVHYNFNTHQPILIIFGRDVAQRVCYQVAICYPIFLTNVNVPAVPGET